MAMSEYKPEHEKAAPKPSADEKELAADAKACGLTVDELKEARAAMRRMWVEE